MGAEDDGTPFCGKHSQFYRRGSTCTGCAEEKQPSVLRGNPEVIERILRRNFARATMMHVVEHAHWPATLPSYPYQLQCPRCMRVVGQVRMEYQWEEYRAKHGARFPLQRPPLETKSPLIERIQREEDTLVALESQKLFQIQKNMAEFDEEELRRLLGQWVSESEPELVVRVGTGEIVGLAQHRTDMVSHPHIVLHAGTEYKADRKRLFPLAYGWNGGMTEHFDRYHQ